MLSLTVDIEDTASETLRAVMERLEDAEGLHEAMGAAVEDGVRRHVAETKASPNTGWWGRAARSLRHEANADRARVWFTQRGVALRYHGGTVKQRQPDGPLLAIPFDTVPVSDKTRKAPREMGPLKYLPARRPRRKGVVGVFVEGETYTISRGENKGEQGVRRKPGGSLLYTLMTEVDHDPDPTVLPPEADMIDTAADAAADFLATF